MGTKNKVKVKKIENGKTIKTEFLSQTWETIKKLPENKWVEIQTKKEK